MNVLKLIYLNTTFYLFFILFSLLGIPLFTLCVACSRLFLSRRRTMRRFRRAIRWYGAIIIKILPFPLIRVLYKDYEKNKPDTPYIFVCNHRSASDAFLLACLPYECIQVVNIWPFRIPVLGMFARWAGYLSIREMPFEQFLNRTLKLLQERVSIIVFPEGTRSGSREMGQFHGAIFRVAREAKCPIAPIAISGNENIPSRGSLLLRPGRVKIHKLPALAWEEYRDLTPFKIKNRVREIITRELIVMEAV